jgi:hypothetical protein
MEQQQYGEEFVQHDFGRDESLNGKIFWDRRCKRKGK